MKLLPFDLGKALAGAKVVTRDGREVAQLTRFAVSNAYPLRGVLAVDLKSWTLDGRFMPDSPNPSDLFLAGPEPIVRWVNFYDPHKCHESADLFATKEEADHGQRWGYMSAPGHLWPRLYGRAIRVEIDPDGAA